MKRTPEPELMTGVAQAEAYAQADFEQAHAGHAEEIHTQLGPASPQRILDLACGPADVTCRVARDFPAANITALDGSPSMLYEARKRAQSHGLMTRLRFVKATLPCVDLESNTFDAIIFTSSLHHFHDPSVLWDTIRACIVPGGEVCVIDLRRPPNEEAVAFMLEQHAADAHPLLRKDFEASMHAAFSTEEVQAQLEAADLASLRVRQKGDLYLTVQGTLG